MLTRSHCLLERHGHNRRENRLRTLCRRRCSLEFMVRRHGGEVMPVRQECMAGKATVKCSEGTQPQCLKEHTIFHGVPSRMPSPFSCLLQERHSRVLAAEESCGKNGTHALPQVLQCHARLFVPPPPPSPVLLQSLPVPPCLPRSHKQAGLPAPCPLHSLFR